MVRLFLCRLKEKILIVFIKLVIVLSPRYRVSSIELFLKLQTYLRNL